MDFGVKNVADMMKLTKRIHDVGIKLTIYDSKPSIKNLASDRIYGEDGKLYIDGDVIELLIRFSDAQIYDFEAGYISVLCDAYAEVLSKDSVLVDIIQSCLKSIRRISMIKRKRT